jgi:hypothetical protein
MVVWREVRYLLFLFLSLRSIYISVTYIIQTQVVLALAYQAVQKQKELFLCFCRK